MVLSVETQTGYEVFASVPEEELASLSEGIEQLLRSYTNNDFTLRRERAAGISDAGGVLASSPFFAVGDRVQLSGSENAGLYTITALEEGYIALDRALYPGLPCLLTRVHYPAEVRQGVLNLLKWEVEHRDKVGIKSESLSRWSATYYDQDAGNTVMGYPVSLMGFLKPYRKPRF